MVKVLEHCCYPRYLYNWWTENRSQGVWHLVHFGDHMIWELMDWFINMARHGKGNVHVTVALPNIGEQFLHYLTHLRGCDVTIITQKLPSIPISTIPSGKSGNGTIRFVVVPDLHLQTVTICSSVCICPEDNDTEERERKYFTISGGLLQAFAPGKYITTVTLTRQSYESIQPQLDSWSRFYTPRH